MPPLCGTFTKMPFTEDVPSLVTSNPPWEINERNEKAIWSKNFQLVTPSLNKQNSAWL